MQLVLSTFTGAGLLDMAFEAEGFCVVSLGDIIFGRDIRQQHVPSGKFDGVIGGPPCQIFSILKRLNKLAGEKIGNLIPEFERIVSEADPSWFLMENVPMAPEPVVSGYVVKPLLFNNRWTGAEQNRVRKFCFGTRDGRPLLPEIAVFESPRYVQCVTSESRRVPFKLGGSGKPKRTYVANGVQHGPGRGPRRSLGEMLADQGFPSDMLDDCLLTSDAKRQVVGNGVPLPMGRAIARAVAEATA